MAPITPSTRKTSYAPVTPTTAFPVNFPIADNTDLKVFVNDAARTDFTIAATYPDGLSYDAVVNMNTAVTGDVVILGGRVPRRTNQFLDGRPLPPRDLNAALNTLEIENQEARRDIDQNAADIAQEISDREEAIEQEAELRAAADADLSNRISAEEADRINADEILQAGIDQEAQFRAAGDNALHDEIIAALSDAVIDKIMAISPTIASVLALPDFPALVGGILVNGTNTIGDGGAGQFSYLSGDYTAAVAADPKRGVYFVPPGKTAAENVLRREYDDGVSARWFTDGIDGDYALAINAASAVATQRGERVVSVPPGGWEAKTSILLNEAGSRLHGYGCGSSGPSSSSVYQKGVSRISWTGDANDSMISMNEGSSSIRWGMQIDSLDLYGNGIANVDAINANSFTARALFRNITAVGFRHGFTCDDTTDGSAYDLIFENVGMYHHSGWGWNLVGENHNTKIIACKDWCKDISPLGAIRVRNNPYGLSIIGCDIEPNDAVDPIFIESASGAAIICNYFEARSTNTNAFIKLGENTVTPSGVFGIAIHGNGFTGNNFASYAVMLQQNSSGIDFAGNKISGLLTSVFNNNLSAPGQSNTYGANHVPSAIPIFSGPGVDNGWRKTTRTRLSTDTGSMTAYTTLLETMHYPRNPAAKRTIRATLYAQLTDTGSGSINTRYFIETTTDGGTTWSQFGAPARSGVGSATAGPLIETVVVEEVGANVISNNASVGYRIGVSPGTADSVILLAGSSLTVREEEF